MDEFDVVVIGGGAAGENVAGRYTECGLSIAVVEAELLGGECSYWTCMPNKTLLRPGHALAAARRVPGAREAVTGELDLAVVLARRDWVTGGWDDAGQVAWLDGVGGTLVRGLRPVDAAQPGRCRVRVNDPSPHTARKRRAAR